MNFDEVKKELFIVCYDILRLEEELETKKARRNVLQGMFNVLGTQEYQKQQQLAKNEFIVLENDILNIK